MGQDAVESCERDRSEASGVDFRDARDDQSAGYNRNESSSEGSQESGCGAEDGRTCNGGFERKHMQLTRSKEQQRLKLLDESEFLVQ